ncbi:prepilin peptidase [Streptococcus sp. E24BD]|uniref:prepilin peptidase n=1 Tax=Streptococcus sp. E24BD TaxID=3278715 RepID=UPI00359CE7BB
MKVNHIFFIVIGLLLLIQLATGQVSYAEGYLLLWGAILALYDLTNQSYPLWIWLAGTAVILPFTGVNTTSLILFCLAILAEIKDIKIGSGDFFYLSTLALVLSTSDILWIIQLASLMGIMAVWASKQGKQPIAFVPFLLLGQFILLQLNQLI